MTAIKRVKAGVRLGLTTLLDFVRRWSGRKIGLALVYHRVGSAESVESHLVPALDSELFEAQLRRLARRYRVVRASELIAAAQSRRRGQRMPVAITFDDDLPSHVQVAMPILSAVDVPATFFLSGASLSAPFGFWWERLQRAYDRGLLDPDELSEWAGADAPPAEPLPIRRVARGIEGMPPERRNRVAQTLLERLGADPPDAGLRADDVRSIAAAGFEIGFHTLRHDALPRLHDEALGRAMEDGRAELEALLANPITVISYPHGKGDERVAKAAHGAGYRFGFTTAAERLREETDPWLIGRVYPHYGSPEQFALDVAVRLAGLRR